MHTSAWMRVLGMTVFFAAAAGAIAAQQPASPASGEKSPAAAASKPKNSRHTHDFLIRGTVFNENALSFPGVQVRVRQDGEKKFRWNDYTNSRGEFAIRVKQGSKYELAVHAKGFGEQTREIDATTGGQVSDRLFIRMERTGGAK